MRPGVSRADLLHYLEQHDERELGSILDCFGYKRLPVKNQDEETQIAGAVERDAPPSRSQHSRVVTAEPVVSQRPPEVFYRLQEDQPSTVLAAPEPSGEWAVPEWVRSIEHTPFDLDAVQWPLASSPPWVPLAAWSAVWPLLRDVLSQQHTRQRPDIPKLIKLMAAARQPSRIPQQKLRHWTASAVLLIDRPMRLDGLNQDYVQLETQLKQQRGAVGLESWFVRDLSSRRMLRDGVEAPWHPPAPGTPLLILGDLGVYDRSGIATREWLQFGRSLQQAGCRAYALVPVPVRYLSDELTRCFHCISWDRYSALSVVAPTATRAETVRQRIAKDQAQAEDLLAVLSVMTDLEPGWIRGVRYQLSLRSGQPWTVGHELWVWNHEQVGRSSHACYLEAWVQAAYRSRLTELCAVYPELAPALYALVRQRLGYGCTLDDMDALVVAGGLVNSQGDEVLEAAERYLKQFILTFSQQEQHQGLWYQSELLLSRQSEPQQRQKDYWSSLWAICKRRQGSGVPRPAWLQHTAANAFLTRPVLRHRVQWVQQGEWFYLGDEAAIQSLCVAGFGRPYVLAEVEVSQAGVVEECDGELIDHVLEPSVCLKWPVTGRERVLHVGGRRWTLATLVRPAWAEIVCSGGRQWLAILASGEDTHGLYVDWQLAPNITQRFRFIPPQTFLMGSPPEEPERGDDETQHRVTLTQGYWMADTPVTQALWQAVTGHNPSHFKGKDLPVEQVSWDDVQQFIRQLRAQWSLLEIRLPTEAEWECACRAGTRTPFSCGATIAPDQVNYDGNYPYQGGRKGEYRQRTVAVKSLPPNPWSLYEMHGNVWEWCQDEYAGDYGAEPRTDPVGAGPSGLRVVRGGSWHNFGRRCRSAFRCWYTPDFASHYVGVRLALGHPGTGQEQAGSQTGQALSEQRQTGLTDRLRGGVSWLNQALNKWTGRS